MSRDLLDSFRGGVSASRKDNVLPGPKRSVYEAFRQSDQRQIRLKIRPARRAWERMSYGYLQHLSEDGIYGTQIAIVYTFSVIIVKGRNLQSVIDAIDAERCECIQQFDPDRWEMPVDQKAPFVESISVHVQTRVEAMDQARAEIKAITEKPGQ